MKAYSLDLRERVAAACDEPGRTVPAVAAQFSVSVSFVEKLLYRQRTTGSVAALPRCSGPACASSPVPRWRNSARGWPPSAVRP